jgi:hypothetical protein
MPENFDFALNVLQEHDNSSTVRDRIFHEVLESFGGQPVNIFQVGAIESFALRFRVGSGWSDVTFGKYIREHGGSLDIVDIDLDHIANSALAAHTMKYSAELKYGDAIHHIKEGYDIYYLDGADVPLGNAQTLEQFKKIENTKSVVLVDDITTKAVHLIEYLKEKRISFVTHDVGNGMITIDLRGAK